MFGTYLQSNVFEAEGGQRTTLRHYSCLRSEGLSVAKYFERAYDVSCARIGNVCRCY